VGASVADIVSGLFTCIGILGALREAERTGAGQHVDIAMVDCVLAILENAVVRHTITGETPARVGSRHPVITPFDVFRTADGYVVIAVGNEDQWRRFCGGIPELCPLLQEERFADNPRRNKHHEELKTCIEAWSAALPTERVVEIVSGTGVACGPVNTVDKVLKDPNTRRREMLAEFDHPVAGEVTTANNPIHLSETPCKRHAAAPALGQHTEAVLSDILGYDAGRIGTLRNAGALG
jgi:crotonobetainyl-CoA:carnitine CoA-transferase CaiB-like acyl-CoA transferase